MEGERHERQKRGEKHARPSGHSEWVRYTKRNVAGSTCKAMHGLGSCKETRERIGGKAGEGCASNVDRRATDQHMQFSRKNQTSGGAPTMPPH